MAEVGEDLTCGICAKPYSASSNVPRVLQCLHVFCQLCLYEKQANNVSVVVCPSCKEETCLDGKVVERLAQDNSVFLMKQLEAVATRQNVPCGDCPEGQRALFFCKDCDEFQCQTCRDHHLDKRSKFTRDHKVIGLEDVTPEILKATPKPVKCHEHDQPLTFYCEKEGCKVPICLACIVFEHEKQEGHVIRKLSEVCVHEKSRLEKLSQAAHDEYEDYVERESVVQEQISKVKEQTERALASIQDEYDDLSRILEQRKKAAEADIKSRCSSLQDSLMDRLREIRKEQDKILVACKFSDRTTAYCSDLELVNVKEVIQKRFDTLTKAFGNKTVIGYKLTFVDKIPENVRQILRSTEGCIQRTITTIVSTHVTTVDAVREQKSNIAEVTFKDKDGNKLDINIEDIKVTAKVNDKSIDCEVERDADSKSYRVFLTTALVDQHRLEIEVFDQFVNGCDHHIVSVRNENEMEEEMASTEVLQEHLTDISFKIDKPTVHKWIAISNDNRKLTPLRPREEHRGDRQLQTYEGGRATLSFDSNSKGPVYYEVRIEYGLKERYHSGWMLFEIGLSREKDIDTKHVAYIRQNTCSFAAAHCSKHTQGVCWNLRSSGKDVSHGRLSDRTVGTTVDKTFGLLFDPIERKWSVVDVHRDSVLGTVDSVNLDQPLWPVFGIYFYVTSSRTVADVSLTVLTGSDIEKIPSCLNVKH